MISSGLLSLFPGPFSDGHEINPLDTLFFTVHSLAMPSNTFTFSSNSKTEQFRTFARFVQSCRYSKSWTPDDERNCRSKQVELYKNCRIHKNYILLVCLYNFTFIKVSLYVSLKNLQYVYVDYICVKLPVEGFTQQDNIPK